MVASMQNYIIPYGVCKIGNGGLLKKIEEKPEYNFLVNTGMYIVNPKELSHIPLNKFYNMTELINDMKSNGKNIGVYPVSESTYIDVGQWSKYKKSLKILNNIPGGL